MIIYLYEFIIIKNIKKYIKRSSLSLILYRSYSSQKYLHNYNNKKQVKFFFIYLYHSSQQEKINHSVTMQQIPIQYKISHHISSTTSSPYLLIQFTNPFFTRAVKLQSLPSFPKSRICEYQYEYHPNYIKIMSITPLISSPTASPVQKSNKIQTNSVQNQGNIQFCSSASQQICQQLQIFMKELDQIFGNLRQIVAHNSKIVKLSCEDIMMQMLDFTDTCGYKIIKSNNNKKYKLGDIILFYPSQSRIKIQKLASLIQQFNQKLVYYPLQPLIIKYCIPRNLARSVFIEMVNCFNGEIQATAAYYMFWVSYMNVCVQRVQNKERNKDNINEFDNVDKNQDLNNCSKILPQNLPLHPPIQPSQPPPPPPQQLFLGLHIIGPIPNIHQFYLALQNTINSIKLLIIPFQNIRTVKLHQINNQIKLFSYGNSNRIVDCQNLLIMNRYVQEQEIQGVEVGNYLFVDDQCINISQNNGNNTVKDNKFLGLNQNQRQIINLQLKYYRFKQHMKKHNAQFQTLQFLQPNTYIIKCPLKILPHILKTLKKYCHKMQRQSKPCLQLPYSDPLIINNFMKYYRPLLQQKFSIKFTFDPVTNILFRTNFTHDTQQILYQLQDMKQQLVRGFITVPALVSVEQYQAKVEGFQGLYRVWKNPEGYWDGFWRNFRFQLLISYQNNSNNNNKYGSNNHIVNGPHVTVTNLQNLVNYQQQIILILHNQIPHTSQIYKIAYQNDINLQNFINHSPYNNATLPINTQYEINNNSNNNKIHKRVRKYQTKYSKKFNFITILYLDVKKCNPRHIDQDIRNCLYSVDNKKEVVIVIGDNSKKFYQEIFWKFLGVYVEVMMQQDKQLDKNGNVYGNGQEIKQLRIYCENKDDINITQSYLLKLNLNINLSTNSTLNFHSATNRHSNSNPTTILKVQSKQISRDQLNQWSILRINNLKQYVLSYYWNNKTYTLNGLDSYIFTLQRNKTSERKALITIPTPKYIDQGYQQLYVDFKMGRLYFLRSFSEVVRVGFQDMSKKFQRFYRLVNKQFPYIDHFVAYIKNPSLNPNGQNLQKKQTILTKTLQLAQQICLNIYYSNKSSNKQIFPLLFDLNTMKVSIDRNKDKIPFAVVQKKYIDWFGVQIYYRERQNYQKCLEK